MGGATRSGGAPGAGGGAGGRAGVEARRRPHHGRLLPRRKAHHVAHGARQKRVASRGVRVRYGSHHPGAAVVVGRGRVVDRSAGVTTVPAYISIHMHPRAPRVGAVCSEDRESSA